MQYFNRSWLLLAFIILLISSNGLAQANGAAVSLGPDESSANPNSPQSMTPSGSEISQLNLTTHTSSVDWAGLYGSIEAEKVLEGAFGNTFYRWSLSEPSNAEYVYATDGGTPTKNNLAQATNPNKLTGLDEGSDSANRTYQESRTFSGLDYNLNANSTEINGGSEDWYNWILKNQNNGSPVFVAKANMGGQGFNSESVDFQLILPADGSKSYSFYVEI